MEHFNENDVKIIMSTGKNEREAKRELERGTYVMIFQGFIDDYRATHPDEPECTERTIAAITETAERIKNFSDGYFEVADEFDAVVNFGGEQYVIHWAL